MAIEQYGGNDQSYAAGADLSANQYYILEEATTGLVTVCNSTADYPVGILQNKPASGQAAQVRQSGLSKCVSDGSGTAIAVGDDVGTDGSGRCIKKAADADRTVGRAKSASSALGVIITVDMSFMRQRAS
jgi:hypothetical protein